MPSGRVDIVLAEGKRPIRLEAEVESTERLSRRKHDVVLRFIDLQPEMRKRVIHLAMSHRRRADLPISTIEG